MDIRFRSSTNEHLYANLQVELLETQGAEGVEKWKVYTLKIDLSKTRDDQTSLQSFLDRNRWGSLITNIRRLSGLCHVKIITTNSQRLTSCLLDYWREDFRSSAKEVTLEGGVRMVKLSQNPAHDQEYIAKTPVWVEVKADNSKATT